MDRKHSVVVKPKGEGNPLMFCDCDLIWDRVERAYKIIDRGCLAIEGYFKEDQIDYIYRYTNHADPKKLSREQGEIE